MNSSYNHRKIPSIKETKLPPKSAKMIVKVGPDVGFGSVGPGAQPRSNVLLGSVIIFCSVLLTEAQGGQKKKKSPVRGWKLGEMISRIGEKKAYGS